jgi:cytochrome c6
MKPSHYALAAAALAITCLTPHAWADDAAAPSDVAALWGKECAKCHGQDGKAQTKMGKMQKVKDLTDPAVRAEFNRDRMIASTKDGILKEDGKTPWMKGFAEKLSDEQIAALVDYVLNDIGTTK